MLNFWCLLSCLAVLCHSFRCFILLSFRIRYSKKNHNISCLAIIWFCRNWSSLCFIRGWRSFLLGLKIVGLNRIRNSSFKMFIERYSARYFCLLPWEPFWASVMKMEVNSISTLGTTKLTKQSRRHSNVMDSVNLAQNSL